MPEGFGNEDLPYPVSLRFFVTISFLRLIGHEGYTFFLDTRDVFIQSDPFSELSDGVLHFPRESGAYRLKGPYTDNHDWVRKCYDKYEPSRLSCYNCVSFEQKIGIPTFPVLSLIIDGFLSNSHDFYLH